MTTGKVSKRNRKRKASNNPFDGPEPKRVKVSTNPFDGAGFKKNKTTKHIPIPKAVKTSLHSAVCSITDPFCSHAKAAQYPDGQTGGSIAYQVKSLLVWQTTASGNAIAYLSGSLPYSLLFGSYSAGNFTLNSTFSTIGGNMVDFTTYADKYRIVSWGVIARNILPATSAQGSLVISKINTMPTPGAIITAGTLLGSEVKVLPLCASAEYPVYSRPLGTNARAFGILNTNITDFEHWETLKFEVIGGPGTSNAVSLEVVYNVEFTLRDIHVGLNQFLTTSKPQNLQAITVSSKIANTADTIFTKGLDAASKTISSFAMSALDSIMTEGLAFLAL